MIREFKRFEFTCDRCKSVTFAHQFMGPKLPEGWGRVTTGDCGMTGYDRDNEYCPACLKAAQQAGAAKEEP